MEQTKIFFFFLFNALEAKECLLFSTLTRNFPLKLQSSRYGGTVKKNVKKDERKEKEWRPGCVKMAGTECTSRRSWIARKCTLSCAVITQYYERRYDGDVTLTRFVLYVARARELRRRNSSGAANSFARLALRRRRPR